MLSPSPVVLGSRERNEVNDLLVDHETAADDGAAADAHIFAQSDRGKAPLGDSVEAGGDRAGHAQTTRPDDRWTAVREPAGDTGHAGTR
jgi:hypothetical protein